MSEQRLLELWGEIRDLQSAAYVLEWDQETKMPAHGQPGRGQVLSTLAGIKHQRLIAPELRDALDACIEKAEGAEKGSVLAGQVRIARHSVERAVKVPERLTREIAEATSAGAVAWAKARKASDFSLFQPDLERMLGLQRERAAAISPGGNPYDALLDGFEPGALEAELEPLFKSLREELSPLVHEVAECGHTVDESPVLGNFPAALQLEFGRRVAAAVGFDFDAGRLDRSAHPFCIGIGHRDVRMTWRFDETDFRHCFSGVLHEAGHGLYEQGLPGGDLYRSPIGEAASLGIHESQSRLWENQVGLSHGFWTWAMPHFREIFPDAKRFSVEEIWPALHTVKPSLIRTEADEVTYNLHVAIRFEIERALVHGDLPVADLPGAWDDAYEEILGIRPPNHAEGVLQDVHWSHGLFGYFPTYTLGTLTSAQLFTTAQKELGDLEVAFAAGEFSGLLDWLRTKIHSRGACHLGNDLIVEATGAPLDAEHLLSYLRENTRQAYRL